MSGRPWTDAEAQAFRDLYPTASWEALRAALPGRSDAAMMRRGCDLRIIRRPHWTAAEDETLREVWPDCTRVTVRKRLGWRKWAAIYARARTLGIAEQRWSGHVTIRAAAVAAGYTPGALVRILRAYQAHFATIPQGDEKDALPSPVLTTRADKTARRATKVVDAQAVTDAVEWWHSLESTPVAAARHGVVRSTIAEWAAEAGAPVERWGRRAPEWWDAVVAKRRAVVDLARSTATLPRGLRRAA